MFDCLIFFCFWTFLTQNGNETNEEIKKNNQSRYNRFLQNGYQLWSCLSVSVAMEEDYIILEWRVERQVKKKQVTSERLAQMFGVSHAADYCNWADTFHMFSQGTYVNVWRNLKTPKMFLLKALYWKLL